MRYVTTPLVGLILGIVSMPLGFFGMFPLCLLIKWDKEPSYGEYADDLTLTHNFIIRGDLPKMFRWWQSPDSRWPGPMYEPAMIEWYTKYGRTIASWYNGACRNQMFGLAAALGKETTDYIPEQPNGFWGRGDIWRYSLPLGPIRIVAGWQVYRRLDNSFLAVPVCTIKRN